jgi:hypothetical protein
MQSTNANIKTPAILSARIPRPRKPDAVSPSTINVAPPEFEESTKVSLLKPKPLAGWGLQSLDELEV